MTTRPLSIRPTQGTQDTPKAMARAFTLVELLMVLVIMVILFGLVGMVSNTTSDALGLTTKGDNVYNKLVEIQQSAISRNEDVEVRFYAYEDEFGDTEARAIGFYVEDQSPLPSGATGAVWIPLEPPFEINEPVAISSGSGNGSKLSTLADPGSGNGLLIGTNPDFPLNEINAYTAFRFRPSGETTLGALTGGGDHWHITLVQVVPGTPSSGETTAPDNYYTIRVDPFTGRLEKWRP